MYSGSTFLRLSFHLASWSVLTAASISGSLTNCETGQSTSVRTGGGGSAFSIEPGRNTASNIPSVPSSDQRTCAVYPCVSASSHNRLGVTPTGGVVETRPFSEGTESSSLRRSSQLVLYKATAVRLSAVYYRVKT